MNPSSIWMPRLTAFAMAALTGVSLVYWGVRWDASGPSGALPPPARANSPQTLADAPVDGASFAHLLGAVSATSDAAPSSDGFPSAQLVGVLATGPGQGAALIASKGQAARPVKVGALVEEGLYLQSVGKRTATLGRSLKGPALVTLQLPEAQGAAER